MPGKKKGKSPARRRKDAATVDRMDFTALVGAIRQAHEHCAVQAKRAVNVSLTMRNWLIGAYIHHYQLNGQDRAEYGDGLLDTLAERLTALDVSNCNRRQLYRYLLRIYPEIVGTVSPQLPQLPGLADTLSVSAPLAAREKVGTVSPQLGAPAGQLTNRLSYSHLELIVDLDDPLKRAFYEVECIRGNWKDHALVEYALAAMDNRLFVSKYEVELPSREELQRFLDDKRRELGDGT